MFLAEIPQTHGPDVTVEDLRLVRPALAEQRQGQGAGGGQGVPRILAHEALASLPDPALKRLGLGVTAQRHQGVGTVH